jgi:hypothetical protein
MAPTITQVATLRRLARVYRRILVLAVPAALAGCQGASDTLAPDAAAAGASEVVPSAPTANSTTRRAGRRRVGGPHESTAATSTGSAAAPRRSPSSIPRGLRMGCISW